MSRDGNTDKYQKSKLLRRPRNRLMTTLKTTAHMPRLTRSTYDGNADSVVGWRAWCNPLASCCLKAGLEGVGESGMAVGSDGPEAGRET
jgi:hypothetical protein